MKKFVFLSVACLLSAAACTSEQQPAGDGASCRLTLRVEQTGTRTVLGDAEDGVRPVLWSRGDKVAVNGSVSEALDVEGNVPVAEFVLNSEVSAPYSIVYPAQMLKDEHTVSLPSSQKKASGDNIVSGSMPMAGYSEDDNVMMGQLCGILGVRLKAGEDTDLLRYIEVSATGGEHLSGDFTVDCKECTLAPLENGSDKIRMEVQSVLSADAADVFNVILPAGTYSEGFTIRFVDENGHAMTRRISGSRELVAGKLMLMPVLTFAPDSEEKGIEISTPEEWNSFASAYNAGELPASQIATIVNDLDFSSVSSDSFISLGLRSGTKQFPEGAENRYFAGTLNGGGHKILNLKTDVPLVQAIGTDALIKDVNLDSSCDFTVWYGGETQLEFGPLVGYCSEGKVTGCSSAAKVTVAQCGGIANKAVLYVGGLVGRNRAAAIVDCTSASVITADASYVVDAAKKPNLYVGGISGYCSNSDGRLEKCVNAGNISVASTALNIFVGGVCARCSAGTVSECANSGTITVSTARATGDPCKFFIIGGLIASADTDENSSLSVVGCSNSGNIISNSRVKQLYVGGVAGRLDTENAAFTGNTSSGSITTKAKLRNLYCGGLFGSVPKAQNLVIDGEPVTGTISIGATESSANTYLYCGGFIGQTSADVTVSGTASWKQSISYDATAANQAAESFFGGILGCAYGAPISISGMKSEGTVTINTGKEDAPVDSLKHKLSGVGGVIGGATKGAAISDCTNSSNVIMSVATKAATNGYSVHFGGIAGRLYGGDVELRNCSNSGQVYNRHYNNNIWSNAYSGNAVGGIAGSIGYEAGASGTAVIENCSNSAKIYSYRGITGGVIGYVSGGTVSGGGFTGSITRGAPSGGIAGVAVNSYLTGCAVKASIIATDGGSPVAHAGGILGESSSSSVDGCRYFGTLTKGTKKGAVAGSIVGQADTATSVGVTSACGLGGSVAGTAITADNAADYAVGSKSGKLGSFYLWDGNL